MILALAQDAAEHGETYADLMTSRAHWLFELTLEALTSLVLFPLGVLYQRWHDKRHHGPHSNRVILAGPSKPKRRPFARTIDALGEIFDMIYAIVPYMLAAVLIVAATIGLTAGVLALSEALFS